MPVAELSDGLQLAGSQHAEHSSRSVPEAQSARLSGPRLKSRATQQSMFSRLFLRGGGALLSPSCVLSHVIMSFRLISAWLASATVCWEAASLLLGMARAAVRAMAVTFLPGWPAATAPWLGWMGALQAVLQHVPGVWTAACRLPGSEGSPSPRVLDVHSPAAGSLPDPLDADTAASPQTQCRQMLQPHLAFPGGGGASGGLRAPARCDVLAALATRPAAGGELTTCTGSCAGSCPGCCSFAGLPAATLPAEVACGWVRHTLPAHEQELHCQTKPLAASNSSLTTLKVSSPRGCSNAVRRWLSHEQRIGAHRSACPWPLPACCQASWPSHPSWAGAEPCQCLEPSEASSLPS